MSIESGGQEVEWQNFGESDKKMRERRIRRVKELEGTKSKNAIGFASIGKKGAKGFVKKCCQTDERQTVPGLSRRKQDRIFNYGIKGIG